MHGTWTAAGVQVFVGHNHCNDFCCTFGSRAIDLCFGRHSGYGGYDCTGYLKGSRIITFQAAAATPGSGGGVDGADRAVQAGWKLTTHIRMNTGVVIHPGPLA